MTKCERCGGNHAGDEELECLGNRLYDAIQERNRYKEAFRTLVNHLCSCGGMGPNDPGVCQVCVFWHETQMRHKEQR